MKEFRNAFLLLVSLCLVTSASAQFNAILYNLFPLTERCDGGTGLPDGTIVRIYWDNDANGPDPDDPQPPFGNCFACANFNSFYLNGEAMFGIRGTFFAEDAFTIVTTTPQPSLYYLRVSLPEIIWTSRVITIANGLNEYDFTQGWTCEQLNDQCENHFIVELDSMSQDPNNRKHFTYVSCIEFCAGQTAFLQNIPLPFAGGGFATLTPGCGPESPCNSDEGLAHAYPLWENGTNTVQFWEYEWDAWIPMVSPVSGWACLYVDIILPVSQGTFDAVAGDGRVVLNWNTLAESNVERFDLMRRSESDVEIAPVASLPAANDPGGAAYSYVDRDVINGETYTYTLETVNLNGSREEWGAEVTATPRADVITEYALHQNYPNPFNPTTRIEFDVLEDNTVTLQVFNINGQLVSTPVNGAYPAGHHTISFDASSLSAGVYFYTVNVGESFTDTKKMLLLK